MTQNYHIFSDEENAKPNNDCTDITSVISTLLPNFVIVFYIQYYNRSYLVVVSTYKMDDFRYNYNLVNHFELAFTLNCKSNRL